VPDSMAHHGESLCDRLGGHANGELMSQLLSGAPSLLACAEKIKTNI
jgi:hypothetical protein